MDKGFVENDSGSSAVISNNNSSSSSNNTDMFLKYVNKNSHKITKPIRKTPPPPPVSSSAVPVMDPIPQPPSQGQALAQAQSQQPPVYNINKNDFRDVVQKLTGSPAHERFPTPFPPVSQARPPSSRLQRIRPPPLAQISNRPPLLTQVVPHPQNDLRQRGPTTIQPSTPLPPLPSVHTAAESPISAYMRFLENSASSSVSSLWSRAPPIGPHFDPLLPPKEQAAQPQPISPLAPAESPISAYMRALQSSANPSSNASTQWQNVAPLPAKQQLPPIPSSASSSSPFPVLPLSPLPFGCIPSPRSYYGMLSPSHLLSPTGQFGLPQLPLSPTLPVPSPRWKGM